MFTLLRLLSIPPVIRIVAFIFSLPRIGVKFIHEQALVVWDELEKIEITVVFGVLSIFLAYIISVVEYRDPATLSLGMVLSEVPWESLPVWMMISGIVLLRPVKKNWIHFVATLPILLYSFILLFGVYRGTIAFHGVLPAAYVVAFWTVGFIALRKHIAANVNRTEISDMRSELNRLNVFVNKISHEVSPLELSQYLRGNDGRRDEYSAIAN